MLIEQSQREKREVLNLTPSAHRRHHHPDKHMTLQLHTGPERMRSEIPGRRR